MIGADDYITKPFDLQEFLARVCALLRRNNSVLPPLLKWGSPNLDLTVISISMEIKIFRTYLYVFIVTAS
ncbi:hypothetical protein [Mastigocoleus sp. MO_188.B34]|uniref:hypothetical protein n=1 Tax=Mastigocoleus sp. MO_188.B34 TaxID=3036635 RepID=UPI0026182B4C|nr:hypothetical protein [Mastigocoleus sp. MO_188.B34]MDJ0695552.1 hypothetical protein [Mastigocoleus sp. MO_188.B34]